MERLLLFSKDEGFTLIEMLLVIMLVLTIVSITFVHVRSSYAEKVINQFLECLQEDIWLAQQYAMGHSQNVELTFYQSESIYDLRESGFRKLILKRPIHSEIQIQNHTLSNPIRFLPNGNIKQPGTMYVKFRDNQYKIVFQLGRGRFRVEKSSRL